MSMTLLFFATSSGRISPLFPALFFLVGVVLFIVGFLTYRKYRIMADTPMIPVRSVPMGLVHVQGKSTGDATLTSPLTCVPCYYYEVKVEKLVKRDNREEWETTSTEKVENPFYLEDESGKILVNPKNAEYEVPRTFMGELRPRTLLSIGRSPRSFDETLGVPPPPDDHLRAYLSGGFGAARAALQSSGVPGSKMMVKALAVAETMQAAVVSIGAGGISLDFSDHTYRLTETCLVAGRACNVLGTCAENPSPSDKNDRNLIKRGENEKTLLITTKSEKQIEKSLRLRAFIMVVLGAALIVGGVALALHSAHML